MKTREDCLKMKPSNGNNRDVLVTCKTFKPFVEAMDEYWKDHGFQNRTRFIFSLVSKKIKWKEDF